VIQFDIAALDAHDRKAFDCGRPDLNRYLGEQASQDMRRRVAACFVAVSVDAPKRVAGYYTLSTSSVPLEGLPDSVVRKLPRYPSVPTVRLGRLAVDRAHAGRGLGGVLLFDALRRALASEIAAFAMTVDAKDGDAAAFYAHHGFLSFPEAPLVLFMPMATASRLLE